MDGNVEPSSSASGNNHLDPAECRQGLRRLLADPEFQCSERNKRFLEYIAEEMFEGRHNTIKAYAIAVDVFGRPASFDAATDPIVRIEATRLRAALLRYYELRGRDCDIHIDLPKGRYVPSFVRIGLSGCAVGASPASGQADAPDAATVRVNRVRELSRRVHDLELLLDRKAAEIEILRDVVALAKQIGQGSPCPE